MDTTSDKIKHRIGYNFQQKPLFLFTIEQYNKRNPNETFFLVKIIKEQEDFFEYGLADCYLRYVYLVQNEKRQLHILEYFENIHKSVSLKPFDGTYEGEFVLYKINRQVYEESV